MGLLERLLKGFPDFEDADSVYNKAAPEAWVSFMIGGIFSAVVAVYYFVRVRRLKRQFQHLFTGSLMVRGMISAAIDVDDPGFTVTRLCATSFLFLGGLQLDYEYGLIALLGAMGLLSSLDILRVLLAFREVDSLSDYTAVVTSKKIQRKTRNITELKPTNVYEDLTRARSIVVMVFITQCILISFVVIDIYDAPTHTCLDGTRDCPVGGTLGSYGFYILGIFMATVFVLGPKTAFGQSELNPAYWLKLLLLAKTGAKVTWFDPVENAIKSRILRKNDWRIWYRFLMSWLINGVGFHILIHALPIQVAGQSSYTGVVFRAVGMLYLVDLDDSPGYTMTVVEDEPEKAPEPLPQIDEEHEFVEEEVNLAGPETKLDEGEIAVLSQQIIAAAKAETIAKLDALLAGDKDFETERSQLSVRSQLNVGAIALAGGVGVAGIALGSLPEKQKTENVTNYQDGDPQAFYSERAPVESQRDATYQSQRAPIESERDFGGGVVGREADVGGDDGDAGDDF